MKIITTLTVSLLTSQTLAAVNIGLNYPETGPYSVQGLAQKNGAELALAEINAVGGILGEPITLIRQDTASNKNKSAQNVADMIDNQQVQMVLGGSSSAVAIAGGKAAKERDKLYFGTLTYSNATTDEEGHSHMFRECYNAWMGAKVLSHYLKENFADKKYFYITADYTWGWTTEDSVRSFSSTTDNTKHKRVLTKFPGATDEDFVNAILQAKAEHPDVLVLVLFGSDMAKAVSIATGLGLKNDMAIVVPNLTLGMAQSAGADVMEGVIGALPWSWNVPYMQNNERGIQFVEAFSKRYYSYPSTSAASAYSILYQYKDAVERAGTFETAAVIKALEGHKYSFLKDEQQWRGFDHQNIQTVYAVRSKSKAAVEADKFQQDYFEIIASMSGNEAAKSHEEWLAVRQVAGKPNQLE